MMPRETYHYFVFKASLANECQKAASAGIPTEDIVQALRDQLSLEEMILQGKVARMREFV
jgi:hypothetical protein